MRLHLAPLACSILACALTSCAEPPPPETPPQPTLTTAPTKDTKGPKVEAKKTSTYPVTAKRPVTGEYHGTRVVDDYQWLEDAKNPEVKTWTDEQNRRSRAFFDAIPGRAALRDKVAGIIKAIPANWGALQYKGGQLFALKFQPPKQKPFLVVLKSPDDPSSERVLFDPTATDPKSPTTIDWYVPSRDGKKVAISLSQGGTEDGTVHVYDVETGKATGDVVPFAFSGTAGGDLAWAADGKGFYFTRHPHPGERPAADTGFYQQVYFHKLGSKESEDSYEIGKDFPRIAEAQIQTSEDGKYVLASVQNGDGGEYWQYLRDEKGKWAKFAELQDKIVDAKFGADGKLYVLSRKDAPRGKLLRLDPAKLNLAKAETIVPESDVTIVSYEPAKTRLFVVDQVGGPSQIRMFDLKGKSLGFLPIPPISATGSMVRGTGDDVLFFTMSYIDPPAWYSFRAKDGKVTRTALAMKAPVTFDDAEVVREMCTSKDGTKVPINILRKKGVRLDGSSPAWLTGYGGYSVSLQPGFNALKRLWLDRGGVFAVANLRGGGEFGEAWHRGGNLLNKQNVFDDFYACAKHLVDSGHTRPERLAITGGSNGGLLMGAALTQHPEMYRAVVAYVGLYDMLRVELTPNGAFNVPEYGSVKDPEQWKALYAYSPYHRVKDGVAYPAVLFTSGANDPRVDPFHSRKMTARLQAATSGGPVLLRAADGTGHGADKSLDDAIEEITDVHAFLFNELGMTEAATQ